MEKEFVKPSGSVLDLSGKDEEGILEGVEEHKHVRDKYWSSRFLCYTAYVCCIFNFMSFQKNCKVLNRDVTGFLPLVIYRIFIGMPVVIILIVLGRFVGTVGKIWSMHPLSRGALLCELAFTTYFVYNSFIVTTYLIEYALLSFYTPWDSCGEWSSEACYESRYLHRFFNKCLENHTEDYCNNLNWTVSGVEFWKRVSGSQLDPASMGLNFLYLFLTIVLVFTVTLKGIPSVEKALKFFAVSTFVMSPLIAFIVCLIPEMTSGLKKFFVVNWNVLLNMRTWVTTYDAVTFGLSVGRLTIPFVSSHTRFQDDILNDVLVICFTDIYSCLLLTLPTICVLEELTTRDFGMDVKEGFGLLISLSEVVVLFPPPRKIWAIAYYLQMIFLTMGSTIVSMSAIVETTITFGNENFTTFYTSLVWSLVFLFLCTISLFYNFEITILMDKAMTGTILMYLIVIVIMYGFQRFNEDFHFMMGYPVPLYLKFTWLLSFPGSLAVICLRILVFPKNSFLLAFPLATFIITAVVDFSTILYKTKKWDKICTPNPEWGPIDPVLKKSRILFKSRAVDKEFTYRQELQEKPFLKPPDITDQAVVHFI